MREVKISKGIVKLRKPTAGERNKALMKVETPEGLKKATLMIELLPYCIHSHPFGPAQLRQSLDALDLEDYDKLIEELGKMMEDKGDVEKKSEKPSESATIPS